MVALIRAAVKAVILNEKDQILVLVQENNGRKIIDLPGGKVEFGENPYDTLRRELKEEVFVDLVSIEKCLGVWYFIKQGKEEQIVCTTFLCKVSGSLDITKNPAQESIIEAKFVSKDEFLKIVDNISLKDLIRKNL